MGFFSNYYFSLLVALVTTTGIIIITSLTFGFFLRDAAKCETLFCYGFVVLPPGSREKNDVTTTTHHNSNEAAAEGGKNADEQGEGEQQEAESRCGYFVAYNGYERPQLGNQMFSYASFYGTWSKSAKRAGKTTFIQRPRLDEFARILPDAFEHLTLLPYRNYSDAWYYREINFTMLHEPYGGGRYYQEQVLENASCDGRNIMMHGFRQSFKYFSNLPPEEIRREFTFAASVKRRAERLVDEALLSSSSSESAADGGGDVLIRLAAERRGDCVLVGVHMRRGDFGDEVSRKFGFIMADEAYLNEAVTFFERIYITPYQSKLPQQLSKFWCLTFLIFGNDYEWNANASERIISSRSGSNVRNKLRLIPVDSRKSSAAVDLCALSMCDHVVQSSGTFSWWAGFLSRGIVTYKAEYATPGSQYFNGMNPVDYFLPHWIPL